MRIVFLAALLSLLGLAGTAATSSAGVSAPDRAARVPASRRRAGDDVVQPDAVVRVEPGAHCDRLRVPARDEQHLPRQRRPLRQPDAAHPRRGAAADAAVDHGLPHALYARVRAILQSGTTPWSASFGFDVTPPSAPTPLASYPGLLRWTPVEGADAYQVWLIDTGKIGDGPDERPRRAGVLHLPPVAAVDRDGALAGSRAAQRHLQLPRQRHAGVAVRPWSPVYSSVEPGRHDRADQADRHRLRRLLRRQHVLARPRADAGVPLEREPDPGRRETRSSSASTSSPTASA